MVVKVAKVAKLYTGSTIFFKKSGAEKREYLVKLIKTLATLTTLATFEALP